MIYLLLVLFVPVFAALLKLAAKLFRRTCLSWTHALMFAVLYDVIALACTVAVVATNSVYQTPSQSSMKARRYMASDKPC